MKMSHLNVRLFLIFIMPTYIGFSNVKYITFIVMLCNLLLMGNCLGTINISSSNMEMDSSLAIDTIFKLPSPLPTWPSGGEFATGVIDLGGLQVRQITSFNKIWTTSVGGQNNQGATFFEPSSIPDGFSMLGSYAQPNNQQLFGWILVGKTNATDQSGDILAKPTDYTLVLANDGAYFWLPTPPDGYKPVGHVVTTSADKPSLDKIRCVRTDFTDEIETNNWIWAQGTLNVYGLRPKTRGTKAQSLSVGSFIIQDFSSGGNMPNLTLSCLKNKNSNPSSMPNSNQVKTIFQTYSPYFYSHPKESYLPSSVNWYFSNGALLYTKGNESNPISVEANGANLPQGGSNDGTYWLDLPNDNQAKENVQHGDLSTVEVYLHVKPMLGGTFTDIQVWLFYPFNGHATAKLGMINNLSLGKIGEHVGDWEHVTLRISNFDGVLYKVYFSQHSEGQWIDSRVLEFQTGNKFVVYSSLNGHASYYQQGVVVQGSNDVGLLNKCAKSDKVIDSGGKFVVVAAPEVTTALPWLNFAGEWGPKKSYEIQSEVKKIEKFLIGKIKKAFEKFIASLPDEVFGEEGPVGPKMKDIWDGDER